MEKTETPSAMLIQLLSVLTRYRRFLVRTVVGSTLLIIVIALFLPKWYKSSASVFPAEKADLFGGLEGIASIAKSISPAKALSALGGNPETDRYLAILKSGTVLTAVIQKFDLVHVYDITSFPGEQTMKELLSNVEFTVESEGNLTIVVYDKSPQRAADMANYFVEMLNKTNTELQVQNARGNREFIEQRYKKNVVDLAAAEDSLRAFQEKYGVIALPEQTEAAVKAAAEISAQLAIKEVQLSVLLRTQTNDNPGVQALQDEIDGIRHKLQEMNTGEGMSGGEKAVFVPFKKIPSLGVGYVRRFRDVEIQYKILQFISPLYEQAKVEERRQTPSVLVLDKAGPAERKAKPKISLFALLGFVGSTLLSLLIIYLIEAYKKLQAAYPDQMRNIVEVLRSDWFGFKLRRRERV
ncbi:MAG: Wzz/FepE/Etk N-terminal domain-containing protein [Bacteroidota bacterium]